uniref:Uncharacterized protein n=1 Tax=Aegilops tauschii subsp. strangulata TaxID=200361 RepID=A0A453GT72_AEGTS
MDLLVQDLVHLGFALSYVIYVVVFLIGEHTNRNHHHFFFYFAFRVCFISVCWSGGLIHLIGLAFSCLRVYVAMF